MLMKDLSLHVDNQPEIPKACTAKVLLKNDDRISDLPDDILILIISSLTMKEAGSTSLLSKRWRHVWAYIPSLIFNEYKSKEEPKYFRWVDQVVSSHRAHTIDDFMVRCRLVSRHNDIDRWLRFAREKKVKRLQLDLLVTTAKPYTFSNLTPWHPLTSLVLVCVNVTGEILQKFLSGCQNLELLSVYGSGTLVHLRVVDPLKLKYLKISQCMNLEYLEISAANLISFYYHGDELSSPPLKSAPKLSELNVGGYYGTDLLRDFSHFYSYIPQLEVLTVRAGTDRRRISRVFPVGLKLKMLHIIILPESAGNLFSISSLITACPYLHRLEVKLNFVYGDMLMCRKPPRLSPHPHLKILEISGFVGCELDTGFAKYLINTFVSVEKITIKANGKTETRSRGMKEAERLRALVKRGTELEILDHD